MSEPPVLSVLNKGVLTLTMNRAEERNAFSMAMNAALVEALRRAVDDPMVRVVVLTGAGAHFSAGGDVNALRDTLEQVLPPVAQQLATLETISEPGRLLHQMPKPTIAMVRGMAAGGGFSLAAACDFRFAASDAKLSFGYTGLGLAGDLGGSIYLTRILGRTKALEFAMLARFWDAETAKEKGLLTNVFADEALEAETMKIAYRLAALAPLGFGALQDNITAAEGRLDEAIKVEARNFVRCRASQDHREATVAFLEKRIPVFEGK